MIGGGGVLSDGAVLRRRAADAGMIGHVSIYREPRRGRRTTRLSVLRQTCRMGCNRVRAVQPLPGGSSLRLGGCPVSRGATIGRQQRTRYRAPVGARELLAGRGPTLIIPAVAMSSPCGDSSGPALRPLGRRPIYSRGRVWHARFGRTVAWPFAFCVIAAAPDGGSRGCLNSLHRYVCQDPAQDVAKPLPILLRVGVRHEHHDGGCVGRGYENPGAKRETTNARRG